MKITKANYAEQFKTVEKHTLPEPLQKGHDLVMKSTRNGNDWSTYENNDNIRKVVDLYFLKLTEYLASKSASQTKKSPSVGKETAIVSANKPKAKQRVAKAGKLEKPKSPTVSAKLVEHLREEIKFMKRYVGLHNKVKSPNSILAFIKALQRSIVQKLIRKASPLAGEVASIQDKLITAYNKMKSDELFMINEKDLSRLVALAGGEQVYPSINIIKRFIGMQGKFIDEKKSTAFVKTLERAVQSKKITKDDPYADKLQFIYKSLTQREGSIVKLSKTELNGLEGIVKACGCSKKLTKGVLNGIDEQKQIEQLSTSSVLTAEQVAKRKFDLLQFNSVWHAIFGNPAKNFTMMFHGEPNNGKTTFLLKFAEYLAENFGNVLYVSSEEFASYTMTKKVNELLVPFPPKLHFSENLNDVELSKYDFVILDSVNDLSLKMEDYKAMRIANPETSFVLVLQHTKDGKFKGGKDWEHVVEIVGEVETGVINITKSRYAPKTSVDFFEYLNNTQNKN